jgi:LPXTG-motif cell wall-anchored protein
VKKFLTVSAASVIGLLGLVGTADAAPAAGPALAGVDCDINGPVPGDGDDDFAPCIDPESGAVYPPRVDVGGPTTVPTVTNPPATPAPPTTGVQVRGPLPATGSDSSNSMVIAGFALAAGAGLVLVARRRRDTADAA